MAVLFRSKIEIERTEGQRQSLQYFVKSLLSSVYDQALVDGYQAFPKEKYLYSVLIPEFEKLYANVGEIFTFGPKCYFTTDDPTQLIVMEDLSTEYAMINKSVGMNQEETNQTLKWLAKFHAASMVYYEKNGNYGELFETGVFSKNVEPVYQPYYNGYFDYYIEALKKLPNGEKYAEKAEKWRGNLYSKICKVLDFDETSLNVLNHGDCWVNNVLMKFENEQLKDVKFVDYQLCFYGSVASDIYYFIMTSTEISVKVKKFDKFIKFYWESLVENLKLLNYEKCLPTLEHLFTELEKRKFMAAALTVENLVFSYSEGEIALNNSEYLSKFYANPKAERALQEVLPWLEERNALDFV